MANNIKDAFSDDELVLDDRYKNRDSLAKRQERAKNVDELISAFLARNHDLLWANEASSFCDSVEKGNEDIVSLSKGLPKIKSIRNEANQIIIKDRIKTVDEEVETFDKKKHDLSWAHEAIGLASAIEKNYSDIATLSKGYKRLQLIKGEANKIIEEARKNEDELVKHYINLIDKLNKEEVSVSWAKKVVQLSEELSSLEEKVIRRITNYSLVKEMMKKTEIPLKASSFEEELVKIKQSKNTDKFWTDKLIGFTERNRVDYSKYSKYFNDTNLFTNLVHDALCIIYSNDFRIISDFLKKSEAISSFDGSVYVKLSETQLNQMKIVNNDLPTCKEALYKLNNNTIFYTDINVENFIDNFNKRYNKALNKINVYKENLKRNKEDEEKKRLAKEKKLHRLKVFGKVLLIIVPLIVLAVLDLLLITLNVIESTFIPTLIAASFAIYFIYGMILLKIVIHKKEIKLDFDKDENDEKWFLVRDSILSILGFASIVFGLFTTFFPFLQISGLILVGATAIVAFIFIKSYFSDTLVLGSFLSAGFILYVMLPTIFPTEEFKYNYSGSLGFLIAGVVGAILFGIVDYVKGHSHNCGPLAVVLGFGLLLGSCVAGWWFTWPNVLFSVSMLVVGSIVLYVKNNDDNVSPSDEIGGLTLIGDIIAAVLNLVCVIVTCFM